MDTMDTADLTDLWCESHDGINYKSIELGTTFEKIPRSVKLEF